MINKKPITKYKRNCDFCAKFKVSTLEQSLVINSKVSTLKSATTRSVPRINHGNKGVECCK